MKQAMKAKDPKQALDAPHTGARLETILVDINLIRTIDAPHTGARLETSLPFWICLLPTGCPPHGGTT